MEIVWYGLGCFKFTERGYPSVVTDPFEHAETGLQLPRLHAELVTVSSLIEEPGDVQWAGIVGVEHTLAGPGEYEIGGVFITGVASPRDRERGRAGKENIIYTVNYNGVSVCHLGLLAHVPTQSMVETIGRVDVLLVPVGIPDGLTLAEASETVSLLEPEIVVPMQYRVPGLTLDREPVEGFLKEMGVIDPAPVPSLKVMSGTDLDETQIVVLELQS